MQVGKLMRFRSINELQSLLDNQITDLKKEAEEYSQLIGLKMRTNESNQASDLAELKEQLEAQSDPKKKKSQKKKDKNSNWIDMEAVSIYDGMGLKGELELYFKALEEVKSLTEKTQKAKEKVDNLVSRGLKKDIGCVSFLKYELPLEMVFVKSVESRTKFSYKSILNVGVEQVSTIKI